MKTNPSDPFGSFLPALWYWGLRDRLEGRAGRANARWGWLKPPEARGKVIWIVCGGERRSVRLGAELARAIRHKRLDVRLVLTLEQEYPELTAPLSGLEKTGWGHGPCDHPRAVRRAWERLNPFGIIFAGTCPRPYFAKACAGLSHALVIAAACKPERLERHYPATRAQAEQCRHLDQAPVADLITLVTPAQVDPNFKTLVTGGSERHLWWWHGNDRRRIAPLITEFRHAFPQDILFVSGPVLSGDGHPPFAETMRISQWNRRPMAPAAAVLVDDPKWLPALAAACTAAHVVARDTDILWQALAGGAAISCENTNWLPKPPLASTASLVKGDQDLLQRWREYRDNPILARERGDAARRAFWEERRLAAEVSEELLQRVFEWN